MRTVKEVSELTGVSIRTLQYYDKIGLLSPAKRTQAGYRLYDDTALERLQQILLFRELEFTLDEIKDIISSPFFDRQKALGRQIELLTLKKERLESIIELAESIKYKGESIMGFNAFDTKKIEEYSKRAKAEWGSTKEYSEYEEKAAGRTDDENAKIADGLMSIFREFGAIRGGDEGSEQARELVGKLQSYITDHYYKCGNDMLAGLGKMYTANEEFRANIDSEGGEGTAEFAAAAIEKYVKG